MEHGKDAKLVAELKNNSNPQKIFEPKSINRKAVFRPILTSPFTAKWPSISNADANMLFHTFLALLRSDRIQKLVVRKNASLPRQSARKTKLKNEKRKARLLLADLMQNGIAPPSTEACKAENGDTEAITPVEERPERNAIICGLNSITRMLEEEIADRTHSEISTDTEKHQPSMIFVCNADVSPTSLTSHLPLLVATYNAVCQRSVLLMPLPLGSQLALSDAVNLRRCGMISIDNEALKALKDDEIQSKVSDLELKFGKAEVQPIRMTWLEEAAATARSNKDHLRQKVPKMDLIAPHIKHLASSTPLDINKKKELKKAKRTERKVNRKARATAKIKKT
ncbi:uncharacterized protein FA14DRAFT_60890 [Meira miltonrushii]|uniref:Uncharacterized protein n=1 Tax=Meira miltonrushii TaxID=1280837 RepID=A0A316VA37_9BASI|nr:uncharacterized protein FA14DRAFT_60890 [Meira miltonrushii]PWN33311.1 hypothetical protein FA14DRAFT_60890 [Meira miltonrushii]